jgi:hypothetical protein
MSGDLHSEFGVLKNEYVNATRRIEGMPASQSVALALLEVRDIWLATGQLLISILELVRDADKPREEVEATIWRELEPLLHERDAFRGSFLKTHTKVQ